jgi:hypothetical protein
MPPEPALPQAESPERPPRSDELTSPKKNFQARRTHEGVSFVIELVVP